MADEISAASGTQAANGARFANATRTVSANTSASDFFASGISAFTPAVDQSSNNGEGMTASDLQIGKATINRTTADDITFDLSHAMGMAQISITTADIPTTATYDGNTSTVISTSSDKTTVSLVKEFSGNLPLSKGNNTYYAIVSPTRTSTFHSTDVDILQNPWTLDVQVAANTIHAYNNPVCTRPGYQIARLYYYTGAAQTFTTPYAGNYKFECWGAGRNDWSEKAAGAYTMGNISLDKGKIFYLYIGATMKTGTIGAMSSVFNGGGGYSTGYGDPNNHTGCGATDIRLVSGGANWDDFNSLKSRIMVAGGAGGAIDPHDYYPYAGALTSPQADCNSVGSGGWIIAQGAGQTYGYAFGKGQDNAARAGGGGGYYGGYAVEAAGSGGSSFISGYTGCNAIAESSTESNIVHTGQANHYSGYVFTNAEMIAGNASMPSPSGGTETGHAGNGYARITFVP